MLGIHKCRLRYSLAAGVLILAGFLMTSCLSHLFNQPPKPAIAIAEGNPYGPAPLEITFDISGSFDPDGEIVSFTFDLGDESEPVEGSNLSEPIIHTYENSGTYFARVTVTDDDGRSAVSPGLLISPK